jgi:hypothetical protein
VNFPETQRLGRLAEIKVEEIFTSWSWTVGKDHIDTGYDFFVQPDVSKFNGHRFLVQVKATNRSANGRTAKVSKTRLREYAKNPIPVFLIWSSPDAMHWMHIQPWIKLNTKRLSGSGDAGVKLPANQTLNNKDIFSSHLSEIFRPVYESGNALTVLANERSMYLSSIDSRFGVKAGIRDGAQTYEIYVKKEPATVGFVAKIKKKEENRTAIEDAIRYGLPASVEVEDFHVEGSDLFDRIGMNRSSGTLSIHPDTARECCVTLFPGSSYSILSSSYSFPAKLYSGHTGFAISNEHTKDILCFTLRSNLTDINDRTANVRIQLRSDAIGGRPIKQIDELGALGDWANETIEKSEMHFDLSFGLGRVKLNYKKSEIAQLLPLIDVFFIAGRLHKIARALDSDFILDGDSLFSSEDADSILLAYRILKGDRVRANIGPIELTPSRAIDPNAEHELYVETTLDLICQARLVGSIPVAIDLIGFSIATLSDSTGVRITQQKDGYGVMYYNERTVKESDGN